MDFILTAPEMVKTGLIMNIFERRVNRIFCQTGCWINSNIVLFKEGKISYPKHLKKRTTVFSERRHLYHLHSISTKEVKGEQKLRVVFAFPTTPTT